MHSLNMVYNINKLHIEKITGFVESVSFRYFVRRYSFYVNDAATKN